VRAATIGVAVQVGSTVSVNEQVAPVVEIGSRLARFAHRLPQQDSREPVAAARDDNAWGDDACAVAAGTLLTATVRRLEATVKGQ